MSHEQPTTAHAVQDEAPARTAPPEPPAYAPVAEQDWLDGAEELPRRPRRRLLGAGANRLALALLGVLLIACGFIGGVLVEKGESGSGSTGAGSGTAAFASRLRALRGGASAGSGSAAAATGASVAGGFTRPTAGTVAYLAGSTLYVTGSEGNTVKVATSPATSVTKTVKASVHAIHPGETVTITGTTGAGGQVSAESISVGSGGGSLAALFGAGAKSASGGAGGGAKGGEPALFGG